MAAYRLRRLGQVLSNELGVASRDAKERQTRSMGSPATLLPVAKGPDADAEGLRELRLGEVDEASKGNDVVAILDLSAEEAATYGPGKGSSELVFGEFLHVYLSPLM